LRGGESIESIIERKGRQGCTRRLKRPQARKDRLDISKKIKVEVTWTSKTASTVSVVNGSHDGHDPYRPQVRRN